tara:strand:+ start:167 stop:697 length:531 start_codon:yes stop_codon:yes gene_type:complete
MKLKKIYKYLSLLIFFMITTKSYGEIKIAYFDLNYIMAKSKAGISISKQLSDIKKKNITKLNKMEKDLNSKDKKLIAQKNILSKEDFTQQVKDLRKEAQEYENLRRNLIKDSNNKFIKAQGDLVKKLNPILAKYSEDNKITLILQKKMIVIGKTELDITKDILELTNKEINSIKLN